jgi:hypothetical protein
VNKDPISTVHKPLKGFVNYLRTEAFRRWPEVFPDPDFPKRLVEWRASDGVENTKTAPPQSEKVEYHCLWIAEVYPPSHLDGPPQRPTTAKTKPPSVAFINNVDQANEWVLESRLSNRMSWLNLGLIEFIGKKQFYGTYKAELPEEVEFITAQLFNLTASLTCILVNFIFTDSAALQIDVAFRRDYSSDVEKPSRKRRSYVITGPETQRTRAVDRVRRSLRESAFRWLAETVPGFFTSGGLDGQFPGCELITLQEAEPFPPTPSQQYLKVLHMDTHWGACSSPDLPGFRLAVTRDRPWHTESDTFLLTLAAKSSDIDEKELESYGGRSRSSYAQYLDRRIGYLLSRWRHALYWSATNAR